MSQSSLTNLKNLSLTLYGYHIRNTIDEGTEPIEKAQTIWEDLSKIPGLQGLKNDLLCYTNNEYTPDTEDKQTTEYLNLSNSPLTFDLSDQVQGSLSPYRLHDTYAFDLSLNADTFEDLKQVKKPLFSFLNPDLGSTWLFYAEFDYRSLDYITLAQEIIAELFPNFNSPKLIKQDSLELWPFLSFDVGNSSPIFVIFCPNSDWVTDSINQRLLNLFWYYHKILYAYKESRKLDKEGRDIYANIEDIVNYFKQDFIAQDRLSILKNRLLEIPRISIDYATTLRNIKDHQNTIIANLENLNNTIERMKTIPDTELSYFEEFIKQAQVFIKQISTDLGFLYPGENLLQRLTDNIRGVVGIEQVEQNERGQEIDKRLERLIAYFGIGLAVSSISSTVMTEAGQKLLNDLFKLNICLGQSSSFQYLCLGLINMFFHLLLGLIIAIPTTALVLKFFNRASML